MKRIRIGNGCGFWGDNLDAPIRLAQHGQLDYLTLEYLAELTMSILALQKQKDPQAGFAGDFLDVLALLTPILQQQPQLKIITNAGGMNPSACAAKARVILDQAGLADRRIATVQGDDLLPRLDDLLAQHPFHNLDTGEPLSKVRPRVVSANAYLGAQPIVEGLRQGASIIITGRVADASLTVAPAVHEFGWSWSDWDRLAAATVAGHLIECGAQVSGGLWCNWKETDLADVGYPIAEMDESGGLLITKPAGSGGSVNTETVAEQLLYEVGDPAAYLTPDVVAEFTSVPPLTQAGPDQVRVSDSKGKPATDSYKVSIAYRDGWTASGTLVIFGPDAPAKARQCGEIVLARLARAGAAPEHANIECLGAGDCVPGVVASMGEPAKVVLRITVRDARRPVVERFSRELAPLVTSGPPGVTGYTTGRPQVREVFAYWPALVDKSAVAASVNGS